MPKAFLFTNRRYIGKLFRDQPYKWTDKGKENVVAKLYDVIPLLETRGRRDSDAERQPAATAAEIATVRAPCIEETDDDWKSKSTPHKIQLLPSLTQTPDMTAAKAADAAALDAADSFRPPKPLAIVGAAAIAADENNNSGSIAEVPVMATSSQQQLLPPPPAPMSPAESAHGAHACQDCGKRYSTSSNLARHRQIHRSINDKKARACPQCGKVYVSMPAYSMHVRTHSQGCECPQCGKRFSRPWLLQGHIRTHTGEKPFKCAQCDKAFADKSNLRAHVQTHSADKPYVCERCGKAFALKSYLYKHEESSCLRSKTSTASAGGAASGAGHHHHQRSSSTSGGGGCGGGSSIAVGCLGEPGSPALP